MAVTGLEYHFQTRESEHSFCVEKCSHHRPFNFQGKANHSHLNVHKSASRKNQLSQTAYSTPRQTVNLNKRILPYGSHW